MCLGRKKKLAFLFLAYFSICLVYGSMKLVFSLESFHVVSFCNQRYVRNGGEVSDPFAWCPKCIKSILDDPFNKNLIFGGGTWLIEKDKKIVLGISSYKNDGGLIFDNQWLTSRINKFWFQFWCYKNEKDFILLHLRVSKWLIQK